MIPLAIKMPIGEALSVSLVGILTVMIVLAVIAVLIIAVSKTIRSLEASLSKNKDASSQEKASSDALLHAAAGTSQGEVELIDTDEKEAAVIMAIVSEKSGIPLERLSFKSIKHIKDEKKGDR